MTPDDVRASRIEWITAYLKADPSLVREVVEGLGAEELPQATIRDKRGKYRSGDFLVWRLPEEELTPDEIDEMVSECWDEQNKGRLPGECDGSEACPALTHIHGCYRSRRLPEEETDGES